MAGEVGKAPFVPFVPPFLAKAGLKAGDWMYTSKLTVRVLMRPDFPLKVRILGCLMMQSHGYAGDLAVLQKKGKLQNEKPIKIPLSPLAIINFLHKAAIEAYKESGIPLDENLEKSLRTKRQDMRYTLAQMQADGLIERVRVNCQPHKLTDLSFSEAVGAGLITPMHALSATARKKLNGAICIYLNAKPLPAKGYLPLEVGKGPYLGGKSQPEAVQLVFAFLPDLRSDPKRAAELVRREDVRREIAEYDAAREGLQKAKERLRLFFQSIVKPAAEPAAPAVVQEPLFPVVSQPRKRSAAPPEADAAIVLEEMRKAGNADRDAAVQLIAACRAHSAQASANLIAESVKSKVLLARRRDNPAGFLIVAVPKLFEGHSQQAPAAAGPRCEACGEPLTDRGSRDGVCFACLDRMEAKATA